MQPHFLTPALIQHISESYQTPTYIYNENLLKQYASQALAFPHAYGLTVRYAMKANPNANILRLFRNEWIKIDASSGYEVRRAIFAGIDPTHIQLSGQELPRDISLLGSGIDFVATSLHQLEVYGQAYPGTSVWVRLNPAVWSGAFKKIDTGWSTSSFGIWHEYIQDIHQIADLYDLSITKVHIHIWSENTAAARSASATNALEILEHFPEVTHLNLWWGFKVAIMPYEKTADIHAIWTAVQKEIEAFYDKTGRKIHIEIEPGKYLVMNSCSLLAEVIDIVHTPDHNFIKLNTGMTELPRISMYGIQQPIHIYTSQTQTSKKEYVVVWHCCESWDLLTCQLYQSDLIDPVSFVTPRIWDLVEIRSCGAYNAAMSMKNYNSFPEAWELFLKSDGKIVEMRCRQDLEEIWKNERHIID